jgi:dethiobiotin synthetase
MTKKIFITGIGTDVGKTITAAIVCEALRADYWKPIQAGDVDTGDRNTVEQLLSNSQSIVHQNTYNLVTPMSPHGAAEIDDIVIDLKKVNAPNTDNNLVIEGAGGLLVPINDNETIFDLIKSEYRVVVVSRHYLGSINHTLMTIKLLQEAGNKVSVIFNGDENKSSESIIKSMTNVNVIGRISPEVKMNKTIISKYATQFRTALLAI